MNPDINTVIEVLKGKGYPVFDGRDFDLTLFGIRTNIGGPTGQSRQYDTFDDHIGVLWREQGKMQMLLVDGTTDPGLYYLQHPINADGTAIMVPDHYPGLWQKGPHGRGRVDAFRQKGEVAVYRDRDRDNYLDMGGHISVQRGTRFWINLHPATYRVGGRARSIGQWSAGCQVIQDWKDWSRFVRLRDEQIRRTGVDSFSYSLVTRADFA